MLQIPLAQFGRFRIRDEVGLGGMARVYRAYDPRRRREVAVKVLPPEYLNDLGFRARFEQEAQLVIALKHKAIVPVYEYGEPDGQPYIVMKYMPNGSLAGRLAYGPLDVAQVINVLERIGSALDYAHQQGIVHRDLKPSNVLFDQGNRAYLADFGIAVQASQAWEPAQTVSGTPAYMSPEQVLREQIDLRSDIYSLGIITFEMLCGRPPFQGDSPIVVALKQVYDPAPQLSTITEGLPPALETVIGRALSKDARERYPTAGAFVEAFRQASQPGPEAPEDTGIPIIAKNLEDGMPRHVSGQPEQQALKAGLHMPALPDIQALQARRGGLIQPALRAKVLGQMLLTLGLATMFGVLLAVAITALTWGGAVAADAKLQLVYNNTGMALINLSGRPLDVTGLSFQRVAETGEVTASFAAAQWDQSGLGPARALPGGACYQLLRPNQFPLHLDPGEAPAKPSACRVSQGWLLAVEPGWQFWTAESGGGTFRVLYADRVIQSCQIAEGSCQFTLPEP
jgi:hypothetical protein